MDRSLKKFAKTSQLGAGGDYLEALYEEYLASPARVAPEWKQYFDGLQESAVHDVPHSVVVGRMIEFAKALRSAAKTLPDVGDGRERNVGRLITAYRSRGHLGAKTDPLGLTPPMNPPDLHLEFHHLFDGDLDAVFTTGGVGGQPQMKLRDLLARLRTTYAGSIGAEFMHIADAEQRRWVYERLEDAAGNYGRNQEDRLRILERLTAAEGLERYLHTKYVGQKRFSLEGGDSLIPLLDGVIRRAGVAGVKDIVLGMAHRGRLNVLVNILGKPPHRLFAEFEGKLEETQSYESAHTGDVKYHLGFSSDVSTPGGPVHLALTFNPSHLESVDPVVVGSVRSRQHRRSDRNGNQVVPILIHGDAAFAGQGIIMELFQMSKARGFDVGGTLHIVVNNQIGFTTSATEGANSTLYCTDVAKMIEAPVFHVNGDDPEAVVFAGELAFDFRQRFHKDVVIDLVCYRRHGHNEADEPAATQPLMYRAIRKHPSTREQYAVRLVSDGVILNSVVREWVDEYRRKLDAGEVTTHVVEAKPDALAVDWSPYLSGKLSDPVDTRVEFETLQKLAMEINAIPQDFTLHPRVAKIYEERRKMATGSEAVDWGFAENLAYATLLHEGYRLRLVGQDCSRGTFFHRHAILHDQKTNRRYLPLQTLVQNPDDVMLIDSLLSEAAVLAYEYGYATTDPMTLDIWEAQFGDFANSAQVTIDQFLSSGEAKWGRLSGLTLYLPHGYEGQGPEHSSARLERFLQLCALDNMTVCTPTTPAQDFHMIRRQMHQSTRKPLIVMTPKSLLRHKLAVSTLDELAQGAFQRLIPAVVEKEKKIRCVVVCAGKVYYDLVEAAQKQDIEDLALVRVEQLYPFPRFELTSELKRFSQVKDIVWCQEEPLNQGAWYQIRHHLRACLQADQSLSYAGRSRLPAPAVGHMAEHLIEQEKLLADALVNPARGEEGEIARD